MTLAYILCFTLSITRHNLIILSLSMSCSRKQIGVQIVFAAHVGTVIVRRMEFTNEVEVVYTKRQNKGYLYSFTNSF